nr:hypothetical protein [uncultured Pseudomonas sp.]
MPEILLAWKGKMEFIRATSPFGAAPEAEQAQKESAHDIKIGLRAAAAARKGA